MEITEFPATISHPGKYTIGTSVIFSSATPIIDNLITVKACNVTIDLMGLQVSMSDNYRLRNRFMNLIYSEHSLTVINGTLGQCSGYSIKCDKDVHCNGVTFTKYELGAVSACYVSLDHCQILMPNTTNTTINYDTSTRLIYESTGIITKYTSIIPLEVISSLATHINTLQQFIDFTLDSYFENTYYSGFWTQTPSFRCASILHSSKVKTCETQMTLYSLENYIYNQERLTSPLGEVLNDISGMPLQYNKVVEFRVMGNLTWFTSNLVNTYNLPYSRLPNIIIDYIASTVLVPPPGYQITGIAIPTIVILGSDIKLFNTTITVPGDIISMNLETSRYARCYNCTIGGKFIIVFSKSVKIMSSTITNLSVNVTHCLELCDNVIGLIQMTNVCTNIIIKSK